MTITVPWAYCEAAIGIGLCFAVGAVIGVVRVLVEMRSER